MRSSIVRRLAPAVAIALALSALPSSAVWSQAVGGSAAARLGIAPGTRVRLLTANYGDAPQIGTVAAVHGDSIVLRREHQGDSSTIAFAQMARLDVSQGRHAHPFAGLGIGVAGGAVAGAVVGLAAYQTSSCALPTLGFGCGLRVLGPGNNAAAGAVLGGAAGALIGLVTGSFIHTERWHTQSLSPLLEHTRVGVTLMPSPQGRRVTLLIAARF
jgi:hypothetical protein